MEHGWIAMIYPDNEKAKPWFSKSDLQMVGSPQRCWQTKMTPGIQHAVTMENGCIYIRYFWRWFMSKTRHITLWLFNIAMGNDPFWMVYLLIAWWFSMAMLNNQRVTIFSSIFQHIFGSFLRRFVRPSVRAISEVIVSRTGVAGKTPFQR